MDLLGYGSLFVTVGMTMQHLLKLQAVLEGKYKELESKSVKTPQELIDDLKNELNVLSTSQSSPQAAGLGMFFMQKNRVFLEGVLTAKQPVKSQIDPNLNLLYSIAYQKDLYSSRDFSRKVISPIFLPEKEICNIKMAQQLSLKDYESDSTCNILKTQSLNFEGALDLISMQPNLAVRGLIGSFLKSILDIIKMILALWHLRLHPKNKFTYEGFMDIEMGLRMSSVVTLFGDIIYDVRNNRLMMENAMFVLRDKQQLLNLVLKRMRNRRILMLVLMIPLLIGGGMFLKRLLVILKALFQEKKKRVIEAMRAKIEALALEKNINENQKCIICYTNLRNILIKPCLHLCMCHFCFSQIRNRECPVCKHDISSTVEIVIK